MKTRRVIGVLFVCALVVVLLYFYFQRNQQKINGLGPPVVEVDIGNDCKASPDSVDVQDTHRIKWCNKSNLTNLQIDFDGKSPIPNMSVIPVDCTPHTVKRDAECNSSPKDYGGKCWFPYKVTGPPQCGDPGVHIVPNG